MRLSLLGLLTAVAIFLVAAPIANARSGRGPCVGGISGSTCTWWDAKIGPVDDGDTVNAKLEGQKKWSKIRLNGVQAPELTVYKKNHREGFCGAVEATTRLARILLDANKNVRLYAVKASSRAEGQRSRLRRSLAIKKGGKWTDVGSMMMEEGHGIWIPNVAEYAWNGPYSELAAQAQRAGRGIWNPRNCGAGPNASSPLRLKVKWDAEDNDTNNVNGEWIRIYNDDPVNAVSLKDWWLRDSFLRGDLHGKDKGKGYQFPSNAVVPAGGSIQVHVGRGSNTAEKLYWGLGETVFENASDDKLKAGDGAYLYDPKGNIRAYNQYPCRVSCSEPLAGKVDIKARYQGLEHEWVTITNTSNGPISLDGYELESVPWFYEFSARDVLQPGKAVTVWINEVHEVPVGDAGVRRVFVEPVPGLSIPGLRDFASSAFFRNWGHRDALLGDGKDVVTLRNPAGAPIVCDAWGGERCPSV
jgi:endonuclease YncB( thermonuclease family)